MRLNNDDRQSQPACSRDHNLKGHEMNAKNDWEDLQRARQIHAAQEHAAVRRRSAAEWNASRRKVADLQAKIDAMAEDNRRWAERRRAEPEVPPDLYASSREANEIRAAIKTVQEQHRQIAEQLAKPPTRPKRIRAPSGKVYEVEEDGDGLSFKKT